MDDDHNKSRPTRRLTRRYVAINAVGFTNVARADRERARLTHILELIFVDSQRNVYKGELEVRPPGAPTTAGGGAAKRACSGTIRTEQMA